MHPTLDLAHWSSLILPDLQYGIENFEGLLFSESPYSIVIIERYRRLAADAGCRMGPSRPVDRLVFGEGESPERHLTKVNGLPYRPKTKPWPVDNDGRQLTFLFQFCFADSRDHITDLPGDVLLVFIGTRRSAFTGENVPAPTIYDDSLVFEWYPLGLEGLVDDPPSPLFIFPKCYAVRHRSLDYRDDAQVTEFLLHNIPEQSLPDHEFWRTATLRAFTSWPRMKIGGIPFHYDMPEIISRPRFLGGFCGVSGAMIPEYPRSNELKLDALSMGLSDSAFFEIEHLLCLNFFLNDAGSVEWVAEFT